LLPEGKAPFSTVKQVVCEKSLTKKDKGVPLPFAQAIGMMADDKKSRSSPVVRSTFSPVTANN
jgi:hypothetical protein